MVKARGNSLDAAPEAYVTPAAIYKDYAVDELWARRAAARTEAKRTVPHYYLSVDVRLDAVNELRKQLGAAAHWEVPAGLSGDACKATQVGCRDAAAAVFVGTQLGHRMAHDRRQ